MEEPVQLTRLSKVYWLAMSEEMIAMANKKGSELIIKKAIVEIKDKLKGFVCSLFVIQKKSGGFRPIVNLHELNQFIRYEHFKMENLDSARSFLRIEDWMVKLDLKVAYLPVPVHNSHQKYLRFEWKGRVFQFICLPFGLALAPTIFTKILGFFEKVGQ